MVAEAMELADIELRRRNVRLSHHIAARLPPVMADAILIEQVLVNLMKNAAEAIDQRAAAPRGGAASSCWCARKRCEERPVVEFPLQDTGPGLPPQVLERLFEAFFSTKSEGMGMGLNLCRSIVESHHGTTAGAEHLQWIGGHGLLVLLLDSGWTSLPAGQYKDICTNNSKPQDECMSLIRKKARFTLWMTMKPCATPCNGCWRARTTACAALIRPRPF